MRAPSILGSPGAPGCEELGERGFVDVSECCGLCHSAERHASGFVLGPCSAVLPGGEEAFVCCSSKDRLLRDGSEAEGVKEMIRQ